MKLNIKTVCSVTMIGIGSLAASLITPSIATADTGVPPCSDVTIVGARGTGETKGVTQLGMFGDSAGRAAWQLGEEMKKLDPIITVNYKGIDYEARGATTTDFGTFISSGTFNSSVKGGVTETINVVQKAINDCPKTQIVMMGFSQGAEVMHEAANAYFDLHPEHAANLAKVWLISDPSAYHIGTFDEPGGAVYFTEKGEDLNPDNKGLIAMMALNQWSPPDVGGTFSSYVKDKVFEVCHTNDNICNTPNALPFSWAEASEIAAQLSLGPSSLNTTHGEIYKDSTSTIHLDSVKLGAVQISTKVASERIPEVIPDSTPRMVSKWDTSILGCYAITLPVSGTINASVDWGDGIMVPISGPNPFHTYGAPESTPSIKTVTIAGTFTNWNETPSAKCILEVSRWDETGTTDLSNGFTGATNLTKITEIPSGATRINGMMQSTSNFNGNISNWDTSKVWDMNRLFQGSSFNGDISGWNTSSVRNMSNMFNASKFTGDISRWNTSNARLMNGVFQNSAFNGDIKNWNTQNVTEMNYMFKGATSFNQNLRNWNVYMVRSHTEFAPSLLSGYHPMWMR